MLRSIEEKLGKPIHRVQVSQGVYRDTIESSRENKETDWQSLLDREEAFQKKVRTKKKNKK